MSERSPIVAFGLLATTAALKARTGRLRMADKLALVIGLLQFGEAYPAARAAVQNFLLSVDQYPQFAGERLQSAVIELVDSDLCCDPLPVLTALEGEAVLNGWGGRKDCGHV